MSRLPFLSPDEKRLYSQVQGRTYANLFALVERFSGAKVLEIAAATGSATRWRWKRSCA